MSTTAELRRSWPMLPWRERARFIGQTLGALSNAALPATVPLILDAGEKWRMPEWLLAAALVGVAIVAAAFGVYLLFLRPGSEAWRPKR